MISYGQHHASVGQKSPLTFQMSSAVAARTMALRVHKPFPWPLPILIPTLGASVLSPNIDFFFTFYHKYNCV